MSTERPLTPFRVLKSNMAYVNAKGLNKHGDKNIDSPSKPGILFSDLKVSAHLDSMS